MSPLPFALSLAGGGLALGWGLALGTGGLPFAGLLAGLKKSVQVLPHSMQRKTWVPNMNDNGIKPTCTRVTD